MIKKKGQSMNNDAMLCDDLYFLGMFSKFEENSNDICIDFNFENTYSEKLLLFNKKYRFSPIAGKGDIIQRVSNIKKWMLENLFFTGNQIETYQFDNVDILDLVDEIKSLGYGFNCRYIALFFTQALLSIGLKARLVSCVPMDLKYNNCHWVTEVYIDKLK